MLQPAAKLWTAQRWSALSINGFKGKRTLSVFLSFRETELAPQLIA